ncbi:MAG: UDP-N-acetylmuramoyl-L-alanine--D-glutamate ligase, partial [Pseudomonadales bacterium]|nr:UDP-N-acetylmuramoyl-L-alanine--D-glutamate ligase [Pseudomonadales bacterium]
MAGITVIVGAGKTGLSCARYLVRHGVPFCVMDRDTSHEKLASLLAVAPGASLSAIDEDALVAAGEIILSPGVPLATPEIARAVAKGVPVTGDIAMFTRLTQKPVVAITGSNGKSTVTALVGEMARAAGINAGVGGNIGIPCLDLLDQGYDAFVLEVSSYQLEVAEQLSADVAAVLNLSPDHMDRYDSASSYFATKAKIYRGCRVAVVSRQVDYDFDLAGAEQVLTFGLDVPNGGDDFGIRYVDGEAWLARGERTLLKASALKILGAHNLSNALAALAIGSALGVPEPGMIRGLINFEGLRHRCELV